MIETVLHSIFLQASATPDATAMVCDGRSLTYRSMAQRVERWAAGLRRRGVGPESIVGIALPQTEEFVIAVLATLRAGAAYLPLDRAWPDYRRREILRASRAALLITNTDALRGDLEVVSPAGLDAFSGLPNEMPMPVGRQLAYIIYTSGSTGSPKGVAIEHAALLNHMRWMVDRFGEVAADRVVQRTSCAFDASVWELFLSFMAGGTLVLSGGGDHRNPLAVGEALRRETPAALQCVPTFLRLALDAGVLDGTSLRLLFVGGELLPRELAERASRASGARVVNLYGPTETTIQATYFEVDQTRSGGDVEPIGRPIANVWAQPVDRRYDIASDDVVAELWIGGAGVGRGYHGQPAQSARAFVPDPLATTPGQRAYRSGDLSRRRDGLLTVVGRADRLVKWHGFRIDLGEIEVVLRKYSEIADAVVEIREVAQTQALVAYCLRGVDSRSDDDTVRRYTAERLPHYMIPGYFVWLDSFPVKPNGKLDVSALPEPATRTDVYGGGVTGERVLMEIWSDLFKRPVSVSDNFFVIGGDSIRAIQLISLAKARGLTLKLQDIFECPNIRALASRIGPTEEACEAAPTFALLTDTDAQRLDREQIEDAYPTTVLLDALYLLSETSPRYEAYVTSCELNAVWNAEAFRVALDRVVGRHAWLRTSFAYDGFSRPLQLVHKDMPARWTFDDLGGLEKDEQERYILSWIDREKRKPFEWGRAPVWRIAIHRTAADRFRLTLSEPIFDGWSVSSLIAELLEEYSAARRGTALAPRPAPQTHYRDFVVAEQEALADMGCVEFWRRFAQRNAGRNVPRLKGAPLERRGVLRIETRFSAELSASLRKVGHDAAVSLKSVLLAAHARVVGTLTGQAAVVSGVITNGRSEGREGDQVLGLHINTVPLLFDLAGPKTWLDLIRQAFALEKEALPYRRYPLAAAQKLHGRAPLFETAFNFTDFHRLAEVVRVTGIKLLEYLACDQTFFPLTAQFHIDATDRTIGLGLDYDSEELSTAQVERIAEVYRAALEQIAADPCESFKSAPNGRTEVAGAADRVAPPAERALETIWRIARTEPDAIALARGYEQISYAALVRAASALAGELRRIGVTEQRVLVSFDTQYEALVALLAVFEAGGIYVPVDPAFPAARIERLARNASAPVCLCAPECERQFRAIGIATIGVDLSALGRVSPSSAPQGGAPGSAAYQIYTSGTTGEPKGVAVSHESLVHFLSAMSRAIGLSRHDVVLGITAIGFDISLMEMLLPLTNGARLVTIDHDARRDGERLGLWLSRSEATICQATPTTWRMLLEANAELPAGMKALCGGEALPAELAARLLASGVELSNVYGPTETTIWSAIAQIRSGDAITLGAPLGATTLRLIDEFQEECLAGVAGEIGIGGAGVAQYYAGNPVLTAARFIPDGHGYGSRMYRTGDYGRQTAAGSIEFLGRRDDQVKVRGYRIELGEIEAALGACAGVRGAVVKVIGDDSPLLVGYVTLDAHAAWDEEDIKRRLRWSLPEQMVPTHIVALEAFPMTPNQKIDRSRLPVPNASIRNPRRAVELFEQVKAMNSDDVMRALQSSPD